MKIAILGYSGSGKSTLARELGQLHGADVLHFDQVHFLPGWAVRSREEKEKITADFLDSHDSWVIDGNYTKLSYERRLAEADLIILMLFSPLNCLWRVIRRYRTYRGSSRPDMTEGCNEKLDRWFIRWVLWEGRDKNTRQRFARIQADDPEKVVVIRNQRQLDAFRVQHRAAQQG